MQKGKLTIQTMKVSYDKQYVWISGKAHVMSPDRGGELSGSDFFEFDMTTRAKVEDIDEDTAIGNTIDIQRGERYWQIVPNSEKSRVEVKLGTCPPNCPDCKAVRPH